MIFSNRKQQPAQEPNLAKFKLTLVQVVLAVFMFAGIFTLGAWSIYSSQPNQVEQLSILSEANDAASLAYSQRESFNTAIAFERWTHSDLSYRELQIARALLGQRLQVRLRNGEQTYEQLTPEYRWALAELDKITIAGKNMAPKEREIAYESTQEVLEVFLTQTRRMSSELARISLAQVNDVVQKRARVELYQAIATLVTAIFGSLFFLLLIRDITRRFREARRVLREEQRKLVVVMNTLTLVRELDAIQYSLLNKPVDSWKEGAFFEQLKEAVEKLPSNAGLTLELLDYQKRLVKVVATIPDEIDEYELNLIQERVQEIATIHGSRRRLYEESNYRANHDHITGLLNATGLRTELLRIPRSHNLYASIFFDIDRFHRINDSMGFQYGDSILQRVAESLTTHARGTDLIARISSDEFVLITGVENMEDAKFKALDIQANLEFVASNQNIEMEITVSVGLLINDAEHLDPDVILHDGAIASHIAGRQARAGFAVYNDFDSKELVDALAEEFALRQALKNNEFELFYQPVVRLETGKVVGAESLIRWRRPGHGVVYPDDFLPQLRDFNLMDELGIWVLEAALRMRKSAYVFQRQFGLEEFHVGINVEASQLLRADFADVVISAINEAGLVPNDLVIEVTEHALSEGDIALENLERLKTFGVWIAMDDFGTGYSNLSQLHRLPLSMLKLDKSFMPRENLTEADKQLIIDIQMIAKSCGIEALAEGVETSEIHDFISSIGITFSQGYLYSPALPEIDFWNWIRESTESEK